MLEEKYIREYKNLLQGGNYKITEKTINKLEELYRVFWQPISAKLQGIGKVYLSPDAVYNKINLNVLFNPDTKKYLIDEIDIRLLTNTKDLIDYKNYRSVSGTNNALLVGDPAFKLPADLMPADSSATDYYLSKLFRNISSISVEPLPGSKEEIEAVSKSLIHNKWEVNDYLGAMALESTIKKTKSPKILHLATHGVFLKNAEEIKVIAEDESQQKAFVENPLLRSMLLFAGAENTIKGQTIDDQDDGILTAYEVMNLDLDNTELVVLSACETGLGEVMNGEGVYGMQRAFQMAGAKSLIMSLWKINDQTTQELMTWFYDKWLSGLSKREAFRQATLELKEKYPNFYLWGAFVMVGE